MVNGIVASLHRPRYFQLQRLNACIQFGHRKWVEILPRQRGQNIIGLFGLIFVHVHLVNVDPNSLSVNKSAGPLIAFYFAVQQFAGE